MKKFFFIIISFILLSNCSFNKVSKHHGVPFLENKQKNLVINKSNKNDIIALLGPPSTKSNFDNIIWIYIERIITKKPVMKMASDKLSVNNVLVLEIDNKGLLFKKDFYNKEHMNKISFTELETKDNLTKKSFVYEFLSSMRHKINDPLGKRRQP